MQDTARTTKRRYITPELIRKYGPTANCDRCAGKVGTRHLPRCRARFERLLEKEEPSVDAKAPPVAESEEELNADSSGVPKGEEAQADAGERSGVDVPIPESMDEDLAGDISAPPVVESENGPTDADMDQGASSSSSSGTQTVGTATSAGTAVGMNTEGIFIPMRRRLPSKRPIPGSEPQAPESKKERSISGMELCQEEEIAKLEPDVVVHILELETENQSGLETEIFSVNTETAPTMDTYELQTGECSKSYDVRTGEKLPPKLVAEGRTKELGSMKKFRVWDYIPAGSARCKVVKVKWVEGRKGDGVRSRLVAMEIAYDLRGDTFAGTPGLVLVRYVISRAATMGKNRQISVHDVSCAFLHADVDEEIALKLPEGLAPPGWMGLLRRAMYGTRRAGLLWGEKIAVCMISSKFIRCKGCGQMYYHPERDITCVIHGDDFLSEGEQKQLDWLDTELDKHYTVTRKGRVGPGAADNQTVIEYLHRKIRFVENWGFEYCPDEKHVAKAVEMLGLTDAKPCPTPMIQGAKPDPNALDELNAEDTKLYMSVTGTVIYYALDRVDLQFVSRKLASSLRTPKREDMSRLRRAVKYMKGTKHYVLYFKYQNKDAKLRGYADSDWAGEVESRKSCSSGVILLGSHPLESFSVLQQVIALSSGEAEFYSCGKTVAHVLFLVYILREISHTVQALVYSDSSAARGMMGRIGSGRVRHMQTRFLWVQERLRERQFQLYKVGTLENPGDVGTKNQPEEALRRLLPLCGLGPGAAERSVMMLLVISDFFGCVEGALVKESAENAGLTVGELTVVLTMAVVILSVLYLIYKKVILLVSSVEKKTVETQTAMSKEFMDGLTERLEFLENSKTEILRSRVTDEAASSSSERIAGTAVTVNVATPGSTSTEISSGQAQFIGAVLPGTGHRNEAASVAAETRIMSNYGGRTVKDLQVELRARMLKVSGLKADLIRRLEEDDAERIVKERLALESDGRDELSPTRAQMSYMKIIALKKGVPIATEALLRRSAASAWIDHNK